MEEFGIPVLIKLNTSFPSNIKVIDYIKKYSAGCKIGPKKFIFIYTKVSSIIISRTTVKRMAPLLGNTYSTTGIA
jgi:hypothetical protein